MKQSDREKFLDLLSEDFLKERTRILVEAYRRKQHTLIAARYRELFGKEVSSPLKQQFYQLLQHYHPDRYNYHRTKLQELQDTEQALLQFYRSFFSSPESIRISGEDLFNAMRPDDSGAAVIDPDFYQDEDRRSIDFDEMSQGDSIIELLSSLYLGSNYRHVLDPVDLEQLHEELELSGMGISDLDGLQYCINVSGLDLSYNEIDTIYELGDMKELTILDLTGNAIEDIERLAELGQLRTLYLDNNRIEDISPLLNLDKLEFLSVIGNPLKDISPLRELTDRGVVAVYF